MQSFLPSIKGEPPLTNRTNLQRAMHVVTDEEADMAAKMLAAAEAAHRAEVEAAAAKIQDGPNVDMADAIAQAEAAMKEAAADAARRDAETHADAIRVVLRAKAREGHDMTAMRPADALAVEIIRRALDGLRNAPAVAQDDAFNASSSSADIAKGAAVSKLLSSASQQGHG